MIMYWSDCDGWPLWIYKWSSQASGGEVHICLPYEKVTMLSVAVFYLVSVVCSARWTHALPLYPESDLEPQAGNTHILLFYYLTASIFFKVFGCFFDLHFSFPACLWGVTPSCVKRPPFHFSCLNHKVIMMKDNRYISTDFIQKLVSEVEDGANAAEGEQRDVNNLYPLLMQHNGDRDSWSKGIK